MWGGISIKGFGGMIVCPLSFSISPFCSVYPMSLGAMEQCWCWCLKSRSVLRKRQRERRWGADLVIWFYRDVCAWMGRPGSVDGFFHQICWIWEWDWSVECFHCAFALVHQGTLPFFSPFFAYTNIQVYLSTPLSRIGCWSEYTKKKFEK